MHSCTQATTAYSYSKCLVDISATTDSRYRAARTYCNIEKKVETDLPVLFSVDKRSIKQVSLRCSMCVCHCVRPSRLHVVRTLRGWLACMRPAATRFSSSLSSPRQHHQVRRPPHGRASLWAAHPCQHFARLGTCKYGEYALCGCSHPWCTGHLAAHKLHAHAAPAAGPSAPAERQSTRPLYTHISIYTCMHAAPDQLSSCPGLLCCLY